MQDKEYRDSVWSKMVLDHPEFTRACDPFDDPWAVESLILNRDFIAWEPFAGAKVMDVGANVGIWSFHSALHGASVTAYEADPLTHAILAKNSQDLNIRNLTVINKAIWTFEGTVLFIGRGYEGKCRGRNGALKSVVDDPCAATEEVECISFGEAVGKEMWDFIKIDIEGAEFRVLESISENKLSQIKNLHVEFHNSSQNFTKYEPLLNKMLKVFDVVGHSINNEEFQGRYHWAQFALKAERQVF